MWFVISLVALAVGVAGLRIVQQYETGLVFRLGRYVNSRDPGLTWVIPVIDSLSNIDMRVVTLDIERQETMTKDNVPVKVNGVVWYRIRNAYSSVVEVARPASAIAQTALTRLRTIMGQHSLDELLKEQDKLAAMLKDTIDKVTEPWGIQVERVEIKDVEIPQSMQRAMAQEAEALREKRARLIKAEAELDASRKLAEASQLMAASPMAMELRRMQMLTEVGAEQNTMTIVMMPSEFVSAAGALARKLAPPQ